MPTLNDGRPSSRPSLFDAEHSNTADTPASNRVLAHLEGRKTSSPTAKAIGAGVLATLFLVAGGLYAWQSRNPPPVAQAPAAAAQQLAQARSEPAPLPARIMHDSDAQPQDTGSTASNDAKPGNSPLASLDAPTQTASLQPGAALRAASTSAEHPAPTQRWASAKSGAVKPPTRQAKTRPAKTSQFKTTQAGSKTAAKRASVAKRKAPPRQANLDPDAELLAALLQRRDPRPEDR